MEFYELVKAIGESKSKQEEDRIIIDEIVFLKKTFSQHVSNKKKLKEYVIRALYVEMLGHDATFAYVKAVEVCASTNIVQKRAGYLVASLCFSPDHEFRLMLVNQIQRDMNSSNQLEVAAALSAVCKILTEDMIPAIISTVIKLLNHEFENVRKKAICALHRLYQMDKHCIQEHTNKIRLMICDRDPSVMGATLPLIYDLCKEHTNDYKDLIPSLVSIIKQVSDHRLPKEYDYHRVPAPWIQMQLLKILALLGRGDKTASEGMYEVLIGVMRNADIGVNIGYAIVYECVITITTIYPNATLLDTAATSISRFIRSESNNLKYIGIKGLTAIVQDNPQYVTDHQLAVIDCLEDPDETLKRKTLHLLFRITNAVNIEFIIEKLLSFLRQVSVTTDDFFQDALVAQITQCAETFAPSNQWYVGVMVKLFGMAGDKVKMSVAQTFLQLIADGSDDDDDDDNDDDDEDEVKKEVNKDDPMRREAVEGFLTLICANISTPKLSATVTQCALWVLGEYSYLSHSHSLDSILDKLCHMFYTTTHNDTTRAQTITAMMKIVTQLGKCPKAVSDIISSYQFSQSLEVQQRCIEFDCMLKHSLTRSLMAEVLPVDASCEDIAVDVELKFLNDYVQDALKKGALEYSPHSQTAVHTSSSSSARVAHTAGGGSGGNGISSGSGSGSGSSGLRTAAYDKPTIPTNAPSVMGGSSLFIGMSQSQTTGAVTGSTLVMPGTSPGGGSSVLGASLATSLRVTGSLSSSGGPGNQLLNHRVGGQVWGKKMDLSPAVPPPLPPTATAPALPSTAPYTLSGQSGGSAIETSSTPLSLSQSLSLSPQQEVITRVKSDKERMAAALFGGVSAHAATNAAASKSALSASSVTAASNISRNKQQQQASITVSTTPTRATTVTPTTAVASVAATAISVDTSVSPSESAVMTNSSHMTVTQPVSPLLHMTFSPIAAVAAAATSSGARTSISTSTDVDTGVTTMVGDSLLSSMSLPPPAASSSSLLTAAGNNNTPSSSSSSCSSSLPSSSSSSSSSSSLPYSSVSASDSAVHTSHSLSLPTTTTTTVDTTSNSSNSSSSHSGSVNGIIIPNHVNTSANNINTNTHIHTNITPTATTPTATTPTATTPTATTLTATTLTAITLYPLRGVHPLKISTQEFGAKWGQQPTELKTSCTCHIFDIAHLSPVIPTGYHHVQSIPATNEAIFAATTGVGSIVLIHIKLQPQKRGCDLTARSTSKLICSEHINALAAYLTKTSVSVSVSVSVSGNSNSSVVVN